MSVLVHIDFETRSQCDLKKAGVARYAEDWTTEIICVCYTVQYGTEVNIGHCWDPVTDDYQERSFLDKLAANPEVMFVAHNAAFEQMIWHFHMFERHGFEPIPIARWEDTMAVAAWRALPLRLDRVAKLLHLPQEKDKEGNRLTLSLSRVDKTTGELPELTPQQVGRVVHYCTQDVAVEMAVHKRLGLISKQNANERRVWVLDQRINQRGVRLDMDFVHAAQRVIEKASGPLRQEFQDLTGFKVGQVAAVKQWCDHQGVELPNLSKETIDATLETLEAGPVRRALEIRRMLGSSSIKKLTAMENCVGPDGRARYLLQYHAASPGRWGGRLFQPQNFPRGTLKVDPQDAVDAIMSGEADYVEAVLGVPAIEAVSSSLRHAIIPDPGKVFLVGDYAGIEARIVLALAGQHDKAQMMAEGRDVYLDMASQIYGEPVMKDQTEKRTIGKNTVLGCGFQLGPETFRSRYCPLQPEEFARRVIQTYRTIWAPKVPKLWYGLEEAAVAAVVNPGTIQEAYGVVYWVKDGFLHAKLPSGWQVLSYYNPTIAESKFGKDCVQYLQEKSGQVKTMQGYGGLFTENVVQALARGLLCAAIERMEQAGFPVVLTVHDEIACEVPEERVTSLHAFEQLMTTRPLWAQQMKIPVAVEAWSGVRYRK